MKITPKNIFIRLRKLHFMKGFQAFDRTSGIGNLGYGDTCKVIGRHRIRIAGNSWIGECSELIAYDSHCGQPLQAALTIGTNVRITSRCRITCAGAITIGDNVLIAPDVFITDHNHGMDPTLPDGYSRQPLTVKSVVIEEGCWLGERVCVLPGVKIGAHSIIGAGSVVTHDIPAYSIAVGAPAHVVKHWNFETGSWEK